MKNQFHFLKNSEYDKDMNKPMFKGIIDINDKVYDGELYRKVKYGKEVMVLCLKLDEDEALF